MRYSQLATIRSRVALSHAALVFVTLFAFVAIASVLFWWHTSHQLYRYAIQNVETAEGLLTFTPEGRLILREDYHNHEQSRLVQERLVEIRDYNTGEVLYRNERLGNRSLGERAFPGEGVNYSPRSYRLADGTRVLLVSHIHNIGNRVLLIRQAYSTDPLLERLEEFVTVLCLTFPLALILAGWAGFKSASKLLQPLDRMILMAEGISAKRMEERLPVANPDDELGRLATVINTLLQRLQNDFEQLQRFTLDVSHELRTPLAALRSVGEVGLQASVTKTQYQDIIGSMLEEASRLARLVENLLMISRMDAGQIKLELASCDPFDILRQSAGLLEILAQEKFQTLKIAIADTGAAVADADELMLRHAFVNVIHNAIKFTPEGGTIEIRGSCSPSGDIQIRVIDNGPGIPEENHSKVFERFYRLSRDQSGAGLGLAITKWIIEAHRGNISVQNSRPGECCISIQLVGVSQTTAREHESTTLGV